METGAVLGVTIAGGAEGDTTTLGDTLEEADAAMRTTRQASAPQIRDVVADKGYHSNAVMTELEELEIRSYISEPARGRRKWENKHAERHAVYRNRRRITADRGRLEHDVTSATLLAQQRLLEHLRTRAGQRTGVP